MGPPRGRAPRPRRDGSTAAPDARPRAPAAGRRRSKPHPVEREQSPLVVDAEAPERADAAGGDDAMARDENGEPVAGAERPRRTGGARPAGARSELAVGHHLPAADGAEDAGALPVEPVVQVELDVEEV